MRRSLLGWCSKIDIDGKPSAYYPRFRPRRLVMPVDPNKVHSEGRNRNLLATRYKQQMRKERIAQRRGAVRLAAVPAERTVGDMFRYMLKVSDETKLFDGRASFSGPQWGTLEALVRRAHKLESEAQQEREQRGREGQPPRAASSSPVATENSAGGGGASAVSVRAVDNMWSLLDRTPLNSPVHGALAGRGKALVERTVAATAYEVFPRLRSKHLQALLHESCGLLPCSRVALRLGFAQHAGVEGDIGMWRELNVLTERARVARMKAAAHLERVEKGVAQQRRWYWRGVLKSALGRLTMFPVTSEELQPRLEWVRSSMFAYVGFLEMAQRSGEIGIDVETFIMKLYCGQLGKFAYRRRLLRDAEEMLHRYNSGGGGGGGWQDRETDEPAKSAPRPPVRDTETALDSTALGHVLSDIRAEVRLLRSLTPDEAEVLEGKTHPLNDRADQRREQFASSGGTHAVQSLKDDLFDDYKAERHGEAAPPIVVHSLETQNALKEAQLILKYAPGVAPALREGPIDVDQVVRKTVEVHETNNYATLRYDQQYRQVEYTVCKLYSGTHCIGEGKGETLMEAIQEAALHMMANYYLKGGDDGHHRDDRASADTKARAASLGEVRVRSTRVEEELAF